MTKAFFSDEALKLSLHDKYVFVNPVDLNMYVDSDTESVVGLCGSCARRCFNTIKMALIL